MYIRIEIRRLLRLVVMSIFLMTLFILVGSIQPGTCTCLDNFYGSSSEECTACPVNAVSSAGSTDLADCKCRAGAYKVTIPLNPPTLREFIRQYGLGILLVQCSMIYKHQRIGLRHEQIWGVDADRHRHSHQNFRDHHARTRLNFPGGMGFTVQSRIPTCE